jgi:DNA recombination protein RmuC
MTNTLLIILIILAVIIALISLFKKPKIEEKKDDNTGLQLILAQINELSRTLDQKVTDSNKNVNETLRFHGKETNEIVRDITERLTRLDETNKQVINFTDQLKDLQNILKNPKQRGVLGEYYLETLLKNTMPPGSYEMQYKLGNDGEGHDLVPDAVVFVKEKIIPIDSKFSLENYNRLVEENNPIEKDRLEKLFVSDLKNRIVETAKYIRPEKNTMEFAFMFIPHEAIYYDLLINKVGALKDEPENLIQRAAARYKVIIVSPTSFLAYLQTVLQGLKAMQIEESAKEIRTRVDELGKHIKAYEVYHQKLGITLSTTVNHFNASNKELRKIDKDVIRITGVSPEIEVLQIDKPEEDTE